MLFRLSALGALLVSTPVLAQGGGLDGRVRVEAGGKIHADARAFPDGPAGDAPGLLLRRARVKLAVEVDGRFRAVLEPGFGEGEAELLDSYVEARLGRGVRARAGRFKTPFGYESLRSSSDLRFAERGLPTAISPRRDLGAALVGAWGGGRLEAQAGVFNGVPDGSSRDNPWGSGGDVAARVFARPGGGLGVGLAVTAGAERGTAGETDLADYETSGDRAFFQYAEGVVADGARVRVGPQATLDVGPLHLLGEWMRAEHRVAGPRGPADLAHTAWQVAASVVLVGEPRGDDRPVPRRDVTEGGPGAIEVSARVHGLRADSEAAALAAPESAAEATAWALALHWTPTDLVRLGATVERTAFEAFPGGLDVEAETFVVGRFQIDL